MNENLVGHPRMKQYNIHEKSSFKNHMGEYFVVGVDIEQYDEKYPEKYLKGLLRRGKSEVAERAFRNYLGVVPSSPVGYENFSTYVNKYMELPPFSFPNPLHFVGGRKMVNIVTQIIVILVHKKCFIFRCISAEH
ncbi:hypothetical protein HHI36_007756 [Cryptolaemus montrouzieri]|uniref:Uncharacterized protein n=1 Tax=Cryptolaemus montrouzieri TaxID=559131 RepID=A0ABD2MQP3_9CUCU